uniref:Uncharacterized protein AlNc14C436G11623 n=1 Tax=Albugo laibachii Nc14 TaxID=890382 RepID=F0WZN1_9STRA|nr:conserved hypothetical protein [Albugo laibachii Nc14]|eukprot:CCA26956.1 conserved hypothetical protein [Albugo laibachii Nc14]
MNLSHSLRPSRTQTPASFSRSAVSWFPSVLDRSHSSTYFPPIVLSKSKQARYEEIIRDAVNDALEEFRQHDQLGNEAQYRGNCRWKSIGQTKSVRAYKQANHDHSTMSTCRIFGSVRYDYRDIMDFFYSDKSADLLQLEQILQYRVSDARVLFNIKTRSRACGIDTPTYFGIKWVASQQVSNLPRFNHCYLEYMGFARDHKNRNVGFLATLPLKLPYYSADNKKCNSRRVQARNVFLFREHSRNTTELFSTASVDLGNNDAFSTRYFTRIINIFSNFSRYTDSKHFSQRPLVERQNWVPDSERKCCLICQRHFRPTRHRHHCRLCGEVFCSKCLVVRSVPKNREDTSMVHRKFCKVCVTEVRSKRRNDLCMVPGQGVALGRSDKFHSVDAYSFIASRRRDRETSEPFDEFEAVMSEPQRLRSVIEIPFCGRHTKTGSRSLFSQSKLSSKQTLYEEDESNERFTGSFLSTGASCKGVDDCVSVMSSSTVSNVSSGTSYDEAEVICIDTRDMKPVKLRGSDAKSRHLSHGTTRRWVSARSLRKSSSLYAIDRSLQKQHAILEELTRAASKF